MTRSRGGNDESQITRTIGQYGGWTIHLAVRADPSLEASAPEAFAVTLFVAVPSAENVDVARIDTGHDGVHYDRLYLPVDRPLRKDYSIDVVDYRDAQRMLLRDWRDHVEAYEETHGLPRGAGDHRG